MALDPVVMFFIAGFTISLMRVDFKLPYAIYEFLSIMLLLTIGMKGGIELSKQNVGDLAVDVGLMLIMGVVIPIIAYPILYLLGRFSRVDASSIAAHYGSVSVGTYAVAVAFLESMELSYESHIPLYLVVLEIPAIVVGIILAKGITKETKWSQMLQESFLAKSIVLLFVGLFIGWIVGPEIKESLGAFFFDPFKGILALFLLEMGIVAAGQVGLLKKYGLFLLLFGAIFPVIAAAVGLLFADIMDLSLGGSLLLMVLAASASYIAVPAAVRVALPEANPGLSLTASLGITFPFNVIFGIPLYFEMAQIYLGGQ
jgi:hypothetical protein